MPVTHATMHTPALDGAKPSTTQTVHGASVPEATRNGARSGKAAVGMTRHAAALDDALTMSVLIARVISFITIPPGGNPLMTVSPGVSSFVTIFPGFSSLMPISSSFGSRHMSIVFMMRRFGRMISAAHEFAEAKTGIVRNLSETLTRSESRYDLPEGVTRSPGQ
jgi:hypothetical protein